MNNHLKVSSARKYLKTIFSKIAIPTEIIGGSTFWWRLKIVGLRLLIIVQDSRLVSYEPGPCGFVCYIAYYNYIICRHGPSQRWLAGVWDPNPALHHAALRVVAVGAPSYHPVWSERHRQDVPRTETGATRRHQVRLYTRDRKIEGGVK